MRPVSLKRVDTPLPDTRAQDLFSVSGAARPRLPSPPVMAARESTILRDTSDTIGMPPLRATHSQSDSDLGVHSSNINNDMGSQPSAFMFHNAAKMTHQLQHAKCSEQIGDIDDL